MLTLFLLHYAIVRLAELFVLGSSSHLSILALRILLAGASEF